MPEVQSPARSVDARAVKPPRDYEDWSARFFLQLGKILEQRPLERAWAVDFHRRLGVFLNRPREGAAVRYLWRRCKPAQASECEVCRDPDSDGHPRHMQAKVPKPGGKGFVWQQIRESDAERAWRLAQWEQEYLAAKARESLAELEALRAETVEEAGLTTEERAEAEEQIRAALRT